jgi:hypothetical protein
VQASFTLNPGGSLLLCFTDKKAEKPAPEKPGPGTPLQLKQTAVRQTNANVLTLDYCYLRLDNVLKGPEYFYQAQTRVYQSVGFRKNPWDNGVQFKSQLMEKDSFPGGSGFEATYSFSVAEGTDLSGMKAVVERPEYFRVSVNGIHVMPVKGEWWLDKDFAVYDISAQVKTGMNNLTVRVKPMRILAELEPVYILGDFSLKSEKAGYSIIPAVELGTGSWKKFGKPMYGGKVAYSATFDAGLKKDKVFTFKPGKWNGVVAELNVNKQPAGILLNDLEERDITAWIQDGENEVALIVCGSLRNVLGPFHSDRSTGSTWPSMFWKSPATGQPPGDQYFTLDYGLMEPFEIIVFNK